MNRTSLKGQAEANFVSRHGPNAVPIVNEDSRQSWAKHDGVKTVIVPTPYYALITGSVGYSTRAMMLTKSSKLVMTPQDYLNEFWSQLEFRGKDTICDDTKTDWASLIERSKDWKAS